MNKADYPPSTLIGEKLTAGVISTLDATEKFKDVITSLGIKQWQSSLKKILTNAKLKGITNLNYYGKGGESTWRAGQKDAELRRPQKRQLKRQPQRKNRKVRK